MIMADSGTERRGSLSVGETVERAVRRLLFGERVEGPGRFDDVAEVKDEVAQGGDSTRVRQMVGDVLDKVRNRRGNPHAGWNDEERRKVDKDV